MTDISSKDNCGPLRQERRRLREERVHPSKLDIHFEADIGAILLFWHSGVRYLETLCWETDDSVANALDLRVEWDAFVGQQAHNELWLRFDGISSAQPDIFERSFDVSLSIGIQCGWFLVHNILSGPIGKRVRNDDQNLGINAVVRLITTPKTHTMPVSEQVMINSRRKASTASGLISRSVPKTTTPHEPSVAPAATFLSIKFHAPSRGTKLACLEDGL